MQMTLGKCRKANARSRALLALAVVLLCSTTLGWVSAAGSMASDSAPPNVLMIVTDDQRYDELSSMPNVRDLIAGEGVSFSRAYVTYPLCCPSRASLLTGLYAHNHEVRGNIAPLGGWGRFASLHEGSALPVELDQAGYETGFAGKYMNGYMKGSPSPPHKPPGWDSWTAKTSAGNYLDFYYNYELVSSAGFSEPPDYTQYGFEPGDYMTDVVGSAALDFIESRPDDAADPFFLAFWPGGPHFPFEPAPRHWGEMSSTKLPPLAASNEADITDKPNWLRKSVVPIRKAGLKRINAERKRRLEQLLSVDEAIGALLESLRQRGVLQDTFVIFTSDNGYLRGEHRIPSGKYLPYEPSARVPLIIRGPGIPPGRVSRELVSLMDVPQTIREITTGIQDPEVDGRSLLPFARDPKIRTRRPVLIEGFTGDTGEEDEPLAGSNRNPAIGLEGVSDLEQEPGGIEIARGNRYGRNRQVTWRAPGYEAIRTNRYLFVAYSNGQSELYDMKRDPAQMDNQTDATAYRQVRAWLLKLLIGYSSCSGESCRAESGPEPAPRRVGG